MGARLRFSRFGLLLIALFFLFCYLANLGLGQAIQSDLAAASLIIFPILTIIIFGAFARITEPLMDLVDFGQKHAERMKKSSLFMISFGMLIIFFSILILSAGLAGWFASSVFISAVPIFIFSLILPALSGFVFWMHLVGLLDKRKKKREKKEKKAVQLFRSGLIALTAISILASSYLIAEGSSDMLSAIKGSMLASMVLPLAFNLLIIGGIAGAFFGLRPLAIEHELFAPLLYPVFAILGAIVGGTAFVISSAL